jgi:hypothetical protein
VIKETLNEEVSSINLILSTEIDGSLLIPSSTLNHLYPIFIPGLLSADAGKVTV